MIIRLIPKPRDEGAIVPEGLSITKTAWSDHIYIRRGDQMAIFRITNYGKITYRVITRES